MRLQLKIDRYPGGPGGWLASATDQATSGRESPRARREVAGEKAGAGAEFEGWGGDLLRQPIGEPGGSLALQRGVRVILGRAAVEIGQAGRHHDA